MNSNMENLVEDEAVNVNNHNVDAANDEYFSLSESEDDTTNANVTVSCDVSENEEANTIDEESIKLKEMSLNDVEVEEVRSKTTKLKDEGNAEFKSENYHKAIDLYTEALKVCLYRLAEVRAVLYSNRAAAFIKISDNEKALEDSKKAVDLNPKYIKARMRRAELYEKLDKLDEALEDYQEIVRQDSSQHLARSACQRLPTKINERNERTKNEMIDKLKDLGNMVLKPFGLSTNNFKVQQDPTTGSYSINFQQNPPS